MKSLASKDTIERGELDLGSVKRIKAERARKYLRVDLTRNDNVHVISSWNIDDADYLVAVGALIAEIREHGKSKEEVIDMMVSTIDIVYRPKDNSIN